MKGFFGKNTGVGFVLGMGVDLGGNLCTSLNGAAGNAINNILVFSPTAERGCRTFTCTIAGSATLLAANTLGGSFDRGRQSLVSSRGRRKAPASTAILEFAALRSQWKCCSHSRDHGK